MHPEAHEWVLRWACADPIAVLDLGGRNVNGTPRKMFPNAVYRTLDILPGDGVDFVADAGTWEPDQEYDYVLSTECFEHAANWRDIIGTAMKALRPGGLFVATMAGPGRPVHSGIDGGAQLHDGEHYGNVRPEDLHDALASVGFTQIDVDQQFDPCDVRCSAVKPVPVPSLCDACGRTDTLPKNHELFDVVLVASDDPDYVPVPTGRFRSTHHHCPEE